jgi:hypothetical protein
MFLRLPNDPAQTSTLLFVVSFNLPSQQAGAVMPEHIGA